MSRRRTALGWSLAALRPGATDATELSPSGLQVEALTLAPAAGILGVPSAFVGYGNNQMLCADPTTRRVRRFLVGPRRCEITGCFATPGETTLFVGIQHPGEPTGPTVPGSEKALSSWPDGNAGGRPRSALLAITKLDDGEIGS